MNPMISPQQLLDIWESIMPKSKIVGASALLQKHLLSGVLPVSVTLRTTDAQRGILLKLPTSSVVKEWQTLALTGLSFESPIQFAEGYGLPITLTDTKSIDIFATLCSDFVGAISQELTAETAVKALSKRIGHWCRFLQRRTSQLSEEEVRGLIGELDILQNVITRDGVDQALDSWKGPDGELHDFHLEAFRIEAKTWFNKDLPRIAVSDPHQIIADELWPILLAVAQLGRSENTGKTLPEWVQELATLMNEPQTHRFDNLLASVGYLSAQSDQYATPYAVINTSFHKITSTFPRLDTSIIPAGICSIRYSIELNAIEKFRVESPFSE